MNTEWYNVKVNDHMIRVSNRIMITMRRLFEVSIIG